MKKTISFILAMLLVISITGSAFAFSDTSSHWAEKEINYLSGKSILTGYPDGSFKPDSPVTRAEFLSICQRLASSNILELVNFSDVSQDAWYAKGIRQAKLMGIAPYLGTQAYPMQNATREEVATTLALLYGFRPGTLLSFSDADKINPNYRSNVASLLQYGVIKGYPDGGFKPQKEVSRGELCAMLFKLLTIKGSPTETNPYARSILDKSKLLELMGDESVSNDLRKEASVVYSDFYATYSQVKDIENKLEKDIERARRAKIVKEDKKEEEIRESESNLNERFYFFPPMGGFNIPKKKISTFYFGNGKGEVISELGKEIPINASQEYSIEFLKSLVVLHDASGKDVTDRIEMTIEPKDVRDLNKLNEFKVNYRDSATGESVTLIFSKKDITPPVIENQGTLDLPSGTELTMELLKENGVRAYDTRDGDITYKIEASVDGSFLPVMLPNGDYIVVLSVSDKAGNRTVEELKLHVYDKNIKVGDLGLLLMVNNGDDKYDYYENSKIGDNGETILTLSKDDELNDSLPQFAKVVYLRSGELMASNEDSSYIIPIRWTLDGEEVSDLSNYKPGMVLKAVIEESLKTVSNPERIFEAPIKIEVVVEIK